MMNAWSERGIAAFLSRHTFRRRHLVVNNCSWPGSECDLIVVTKSLHLIEVEIKVGRADLRADASKDKWFDRDWRSRQRTPRQWPLRVWKHYYALPRYIWTPDLADALPPMSGVLLLGEHDDGNVFVEHARRAKPCRDAKRLTAEQVVDLARLVTLRLWDAYETVDRLSREARQRVRADAA